MPIGVVGIGGQPGAFAGTGAPPAEDGIRPGHLHQAQTLGRQRLRQLAQAWRIAGQAAINERERQQAAGGLFDAAPGVGQQVVGDARELTGGALRQAQFDVASVRRQVEAGVVGIGLAQFQRQRPLGQPAGSEHGNRLTQAVDRVAILTQADVELAVDRLVESKGDAVGARLQRQFLLQDRRFAGNLQLDLGGAAGLVEGNDGAARPVALAEGRRAAPFGVERLVRFDVTGILADHAVGAHGARRHAPARQRVGHAEADGGFAAGVGLDGGKPGGGIGIVAAWAFQHLDAAFRRRPIDRRAALARHAGEVVADKGQAGGGAHVVAARVIEKLPDGRSDLGLQHVDHFIDHAERHLRGDRFAGKLCFDLQRDGIAGGVFLLAGLHDDFNGRDGNTQALVLEHVVAVLHIKYREGDVGTVVFAHRDVGPPLRRRQLGQRQPVAAATAAEQGGGFDAVAFKCEQGVIHRRREGDQRVRRFPGDVFFLVEDDFHAAGDGLHAFARNPMAGRRQQIALGVAQADGIGAGLGEIQFDRFAAGGNLALFLLAILQAQDFPTAWPTGRRLGADRAELEFDRLAGRRKIGGCRQLPQGGAALDQNFLGGPHPIGGAVLGQQAEDVARGIAGGRQ